MRRFIGGDLSWYERQSYLKRMREKGKKVVIPKIAESWKLQCRCGNYEALSYYRGRMYCHRCGRTYNMEYILGESNFLLSQGAKDVIEKAIKNARVEK